MEPSLLNVAVQLVCVIIAGVLIEFVVGINMKLQPCRARSDLEDFHGKTVTLLIKTHMKYMSQVVIRILSGTEIIKLKMNYP
jgi:hypothetical protein